MEESRKYLIERLSGDGKLEELKKVLGSEYSQLEIDVALENAIAYSKVETAEFLISIGADISNYDYQGVYYAVHNNELEGLKFSIGQGVNINNGQLINTAIITAYNTKDISILEYLIEQGADIGLIDPNTLRAFDTDQINKSLKNVKTASRPRIEEKSEFEYRLKESTKDLIDITQSMVINPLSNNVEFLIEPNQRELSDHLTSEEKKKLLELNNLEEKLLNFKRVVDLLHLSSKVPLWINTEIYRSEKNRTIIKLICSRRFREDWELNYKADKLPPFHILVPIPPNRIEGEKFDINWRHKKEKKIWEVFKQLWK